MESYDFLLDLAIILISTKLLGLVTKRFQMPQVVGALLAGLIFGPAVLNILKETDFINKTSEIGVIVLMFTAGLETDIKELKKTGKASAIIALIGVIVPFLGGYVIAAVYNTRIGSDASASVFLQNMFIGVILTATSVSITVETLKEIGKLNTRAGNAILGAALIDDILGIIALTIVTSLADTSVKLSKILLLIISFFLLTAVIGFIFHYLFGLYIKRCKGDKRRFVIVAFAFCLVLSYLADEVFGVADITGAFMAGLIISTLPRSNYIASRFNTLSYIFLSPIFFASIGLKVVLPAMTGQIIIFSLLLLFLAILTKIVGCGIGAKLCGYTNQESMQIGCGMISRGEVALIIANKGAALGLLSSVFFGPIIITVIITTVISPIFLKLAFRSKKGMVLETTNSLVEDYNEMGRME